MSILVETQKGEIFQIQSIYLTTNRLTDREETLWIIYGKLFSIKQNNFEVELGSYFDRDLAFRLFTKLQDTFETPRKFNEIGLVKMPIA